MALLGEIGEGNLQTVFNDLSNFRKGILMRSNEVRMQQFQPTFRARWCEHSPAA